MITWLPLLALAPLAGELPARVDLRPQFAAAGLVAGEQGRRGTCSVFALVGTLEYELARQQQPSPRLSVEYLNWAAHRACQRRTDGSMFDDAIRGLRLYGVCTADLLPYAAAFSADLAPPQAAHDDAATRTGVAAVWIKRWDLRDGLDSAEQQAVRASLAAGHPVAVGLRWPNQVQIDDAHLLALPPDGEVFDGHSVIVVGYRDDPAWPGGGGFLFRNHAGPHWRDGGHAWLSYAYVGRYANDAVGLRIDPTARLPLNRGAGQTVELEDLTVLERQDCSASPQGMGRWGGLPWSGERQLFVGAGPGGCLTVSLPTTGAGRYRVDLHATRAPDFGRVQVSLDGQPLGPPLDLYGPEVEATGRLTLGVLDLTAGPHRLSFRVVGRHPASRGTALGLDCLDLLAQP